MMMAAVNPGEKIAVPRKLAQVHAGGLGDERRGSPFTCIRGGLGAAHGPLRDSGDRRADDRAAIPISSPSIWSRNLLRRRRGSRGDRANRARRGKVLLVDEAWGPHFHFHPDLPLSATAAGARHLHQLDAQNAFGILAVRVRSPGRTRCARSAPKPCSRCSCRPRRICRWSHRSTWLASRWPPKARRCSRRTICARARGARAPEPDSRPLLFGEEPQGRHGIYDLDPTKVTVTVKAWVIPATSLRTSAPPL